MPTWHEGHRDLPFVFVGSAAAAAGGLGMLTAPVHEAGPARRAVLLGAALELTAAARMEQGMGLAAEPLHQGRAGRLMTAAKALTVTGAVLGGVFGRRSRVAAVLGGVAALAGSACTPVRRLPRGRGVGRGPQVHGPTPTCAPVRAVG